ncbi:hypothetical protein MPSEU_001006500 [Mayamaea pseudoterrestris]|nr:hypothetical protein MPSEU_001006500 [Mayamaea pseudoterrestris]
MRSVLLAFVLTGSAAAFSNCPSKISHRTPATSRQWQSSVRRSAVNGATATADPSNATSDKSKADLIKSIRLNVNEQARTVTAVCTSGTLCTLSSHGGLEGAPFGSLVDYVLDDQGCPVLLMNDMSMHTINIQKAMQESSNQGQSAQAMVTLFIQLGSSSQTAASSSTGKSSNRQQDVSRCSVTGNLVKLDMKNTADMDILRLRYSLTHSYADQVLDSPKFSLYRLVPTAIYYVGGFGVQATWVDPQEYQLANPDILATEASEILRKLNQPTHWDDLRLTAQQVLGLVDQEIETIRVTTVDRLGMDLRVTTQAAGSRRKTKLETNEYRIGFRIPVRSVEDAKSEILKVFQEAWEAANWPDDDDDDQGAVDANRIPFVKIAADSLQ